jgi:hypothetical protein
MSDTTENKTSFHHQFFIPLAFSPNATGPASIDIHDSQFPVRSIDWLSSLDVLAPDIAVKSRAEIDIAMLNRARRMATRTRAETACQPCKAKKARCSDYRPCRRCLESGAPEDCFSAAGARAESSRLTTDASNTLHLTRSNTFPRYCCAADNST